MYTIILLIIMTVLSVLGIIIADKKYSETFVAIFTFVFITCFIINIICIIQYSTVKSDAEKIIYEYNSTSAMIKDVNMENYGNLPKLTEKILDINKEIARYKANNKNPWLNIWYPEEIGNLKPLTFKTN